MPLVAAAVLAYIVGLLAGFGATLFGAAAVIVLIAAVASRGPREFVAIVAVALAGYSAADGSVRRDADCSGRAQHAALLTAVLANDASPGAFISAVLECGALVRLSVLDGVARAGATVGIAGHATLVRGFLMVDSARVIPVRAPSAIVRW